MVSNTAKSHKSRKSGSQPGKPRNARKSLSGAPLSGGDGPSSESTALAITTPSPSTDIGPAIDVPPTESDPTKQWWYRPKGSKTRKIADKIAVLDAAGHKDDAIAKKLKTTEGNVRQVRYLARKNGWWDENDESVDIEAELAFDIDRKVVRNISKSLDGEMTNWQTHEMTMAAAKGRGMFKNHEVAKNENGPQMNVVAIQVVMPAVGAGDQLPQIEESQMGGQPAYIDAEALE